MGVIVAVLVGTAAGVFGFLVAVIVNGFVGSGVFLVVGVLIKVLVCVFNGVICGMVDGAGDVFPQLARMKTVHPTHRAKLFIIFTNPIIFIF